MTESPANDLDKLRLALAGLEVQRGILGEAVEPALELVRRQIAALEEQLSSPPPATPLAKEDSSPEERRIVSILFTDIVGSTALAESLDPEDWRYIVAQIHAMAGEQVVANHGAVVQYLGDGLLALFGAQTASEADPENAVRAALDIQAELASLPIDPPVQMRAGVHTGLVVVGDLGSDARREFTASGDAMNLAARMQSAALPGSVLISNEVYRQVRGAFETTSQPPLRVKGKSEPVQTYLVQRARERRFHSASRGVAGVETRTVGREAEQAQLQAAYQEAIQQPSVVWTQLIGDAGVGKSRLLEDLSEWLDLRPERLRLLRGRAFSGDLNQPFSLVRRMWFDRFHITEDEPLASAEEKWVRGFQELSQTDEIEPAQALGLLVGLSFSGSRYVEGMRGDPTQVKGRALVVSRELIHAIRLHQPLVFLLEDLHLADAPSLEYLTSIVFENGLAGNDILQGEFLLATARPEWKTPSALSQHREAEPHRYTEIHLTSLSQSASRELALELLSRVDGVTDEVIELIVERSEGVPYYAEELVNLLIDRGVIDRNGERWRYISGELDETQLPLTLQHLLLTRLLSLPLAERSCLQRSSVFGRNFWEGGLEALGTRSPQLFLSPLQPRGFVDRQPESSFGQNIEWSFHHALLRDVTYESLLKRDRPGLHKAAAAWLEAQARQSDRLNEFAGVLGEHFEQAGEMHTAAVWYLLAGERAKDLGATREAKTHLDRALELLPQDDRERRWRALLARSDTLSMLGDIAPRQANQALLLELAGELDDAHLAEAYYRQGILLDNQGDYNAAIELYDKAVAAGRRASDKQLVARVLGMKVIGQNRVGDVTGAAASAKTALALLSQLDEKTANRVISNVAVYFIETGDIAKAARLHQDLAASSQHLGDRASATNSLNNLGYSYSMLGQYPQARAALQQALQFGRAIEARRESNFVLLNLGLVHWRECNNEAALRVLEQAIADLEAAGFSYLGLAFEQAGDWESAQEQYIKAMDLFKGIGVGGYATDTLAGMARCALAKREFEKARQNAEQLWTYLHEQGSQGMEFPIWGYLTCAQVFEALGDPEICQAAVEQGCEELYRRAEKISDPEWRRSFLENVPEHRLILDFRKRMTEPYAAQEGHSDRKDDGKSRP
jgi:class 3 adenylate cyclase/predicted ATPase